MKIKFRFIKMYKQIDYYNKSEYNYWIIQKKGWFGWKTMNNIYGSVCTSHMSWSYFRKPMISGYDTFKSKKSAMYYLRWYYDKTISIPVKTGYKKSNLTENDVEEMLKPCTECER